MLSSLCFLIIELLFSFHVDFCFIFFVLFSSDPSTSELNSRETRRKAVLLSLSCVYVRLAEHGIADPQDYRRIRQPIRSLLDQRHKSICKAESRKRNA